MAGVGRGPEKPRFGEPCNGCGYCCALQPCAIAQEYLGAEDVGPCPALLFDHQDDRFRCGMVVSPTRFMFLPPDAEADLILGTMFAEMLAVGRGCDSEDFAAPETEEPAHG
ncbi:hypothetical protein ACQKQD_18370 [Methylobacterium sp. NPDC080182]|uniref:hypothetical protein n=1 Tax=Methylobacterium sp. NPDC080182 TaxID=3390590 RepID=UPI003CFFDF5F